MSNSNNNNIIIQGANKLVSFFTGFSAANGVRWIDQEPGKLQFTVVLYENELPGVVRAIQTHSGAALDDFWSTLYKVPAAEGGLWSVLYTHLGAMSQEEAVLLTRRNIGRR